jgi:hypothetical protein
MLGLQEGLQQEALHVFVIFIYNGLLVLLPKPGPRGPKHFWFPSSPFKSGTNSDLGHQLSAINYQVETKN